jgi:hypothetical protein
LTLANLTLENLTLLRNQEPDLEWRAFLYLSGEMSSAELAAFEHLLESDQSAREAVASAVHLVGTITDAPMAGASVAEKRGSIVSKPPITSRLRAFVALAASVAALLLALSFIDPVSERTQDDDLAATHRTVRQPNLPTAPIGEMLSLWSQADPSDRGWEDDEEGDIEGPSVPMDEGAGELTVPGWLLAAVASEADPLFEEN